MRRKPLLITAGTVATVSLLAGVLAGVGTYAATPLTGPTVPGGNITASIPSLSPSSVAIRRLVPRLSAEPTTAANRRATDRHQSVVRRTASSPASDKTRVFQAAADTLNIPAIGVHAAHIVAISTSPDGVLEAPGDIHEVGLFDGGAHPGDHHGTALLTGHVDWVNKGRGALFALASAKPGDTATVTWSGTTTTYRVTDVQEIPKTELPASLFTTAGPARLVLITCGGQLVDGNYSDNIIVTAAPS